MSNVKSPRTKLISLIHVAKRELKLSEIQYRALLMGAAGKDSLRDMSDKDLKAVIDKFKEHGFKKSKPKRAGTRKMAGGEQAKLIRALWLSLYNLGEVRDPSEKAMCGYVKRMTKIDDLNWLTLAKANIVISGLRDWMARAGYIRPTEDHREYFCCMHGDIVVDNGETIINSVHVMMAQAKIAFNDHDKYSEWVIEQGVSRPHPYLYSLEETYSLIEKLGEKIRKMKGSNA